MNDFYDHPFAVGHDHVYLGAGHARNERKTWAVIVLCTVMMLAEIIGGNLFGSLALVADGLHMSTHAGAMLIAALAYTYARKHANDPRFVFGTGKLGDLAGFTSAIILAMIALLIGYESFARLLSPVPIAFREAIPIAVVGLIVNIASAWLLSGGDHGHSHGHAHGHAHGAADDHPHPHHRDDEVRTIDTVNGPISLSIFEQGVPPVFRLEGAADALPESADHLTATTIRPDGERQVFQFSRIGGLLQSTTSIPEPHQFSVLVALPQATQMVRFDESAPTHQPHAGHGSDSAHTVDARDHNMRAAYVHVIADAAVSVLAIIGLLMAKTFGWLWMDPLAGLIGALVIANWAYGLIRDTGGILVDLSPGDGLPDRIRKIVAGAGDRLVDLHVWRLGPGHFSAVVSLISGDSAHGPAFYHNLLKQLDGLSHITVEVHAAGGAAHLSAARST